MVAGLPKVQKEQFCSISCPLQVTTEEGFLIEQKEWIHMRKNANIVKKSMIPVVLMTLLFLSMISIPTFAASYSVSFQNATIQITSPSVNDSTYDKSMTVEGTSSLNKIWLCLKGPNGETSVYPVEIKNGSFKKEIWLRFGEGSYTVWAGDNEKQFDGKIRFQVRNTSTAQYFNLTPSGYVNSDEEAIQKIAKSIVTDKMTSLEKAKAVHDWVTNNIAYDTNAYYKGTVGMNTSLQIINSKSGLCRDYSFTFASICRAAGLETKIVYGDAYNSTLKTYEKHAWNEVNINGRWISVDTTWDAGYIKSKSFVKAPTNKYFNVDAETFSKTHKVTSVTLF